MINKVSVPLKRCSFYYDKNGGAVALQSAARDYGTSSLDWGSWRGTPLCSKARRHFTLTVPLSTQMYKWSQMGTGEFNA